MSEDEVGYGKPPKQNRFKPGQSGNPRGRPRRRKTGLDEIGLSDVLDESLTVPTRSGPRLMSSFEVSMRTLAHHAVIDQKLGAAMHFIRLCEKYEVMNVLKKARPDPGSGPLQGMTKQQMIESLKWREKVEKETRHLRTRQFQARKRIMEVIATELRVVIEGSKSRKRPTLRIAIRVLEKHACKGSVKAINMVEELLDHYAVPEQPKPRGGVINGWDIPEEERRKLMRKMWEGRAVRGM